MATFIVKTMDDRNLFVKAASFRFQPTEHIYIFFENPEPSPGLGKIVASVPVNNVFAVINDDAFEGDFYATARYDDVYPEPPIEEDEP